DRSADGHVGIVVDDLPTAIAFFREIVVVLRTRIVPAPDPCVGGDAEAAMTNTKRRKHRGEDRSRSHDSCLSGGLLNAFLAFPVLPSVAVYDPSRRRVESHQPDHGTSDRAPAPSSAGAPAGRRTAAQTGSAR